MKHEFRWVLSKYRKNKGGARQPVKPGRYFKYLNSIGAGFHDSNKKLN